VSEHERPETRRVFGEDIPLEPELPALLVDVGERLEEIRQRFAQVSLPEERFDLLSSALDELEGALDGVREAHAALARIERRLADGYQIVLRRLRDVDRARESGEA
jgi:hypothetical protein